MPSRLLSYLPSLFPFGRDGRASAQTPGPVKVMHAQPNRAHRNTATTMQENLPAGWQAFLRARRAGLAEELACLSRAGVPADARGMHAFEHALAAYLLYRQVAGLLPDPDAVARLRQAQHSLSAVKSLLPFGRGNVDVDIVRSQGESSRRLATVRTAGKAFAKERGMPYEVGIPALTLVLGAGNCTEYARLVALTQSAHLRPDERVHLVAGKTQDHVWVEVRDGDAQGKHDVIADAWTEGPAVLRADARYASDQAASLSAQAYDGVSGTHTLRLVEEVAQRFGRDRQIAGEIMGCYEAMGTIDTIPSGNELRSPESVLRPGFMTTFAPALDALSPMAATLQAVLLARTAFHDRIAAAAKQAPGVLEATKDLRHAGGRV